MPGESCVGTQDRVRIASPCVKRNGSFLPAVWTGASHCTAAADGAVSYSIARVFPASGSVIVSGEPRNAFAGPTSKVSVAPRPSVTRLIVRSRVSSTT